MINLEITTKDTLNLQQESINLASNLIDTVRSGHVQPLEYLILVRTLKNTLETVMRSINAEAITELEKYGKHGATLYGYDVKLVNAPGRWDYSECNHQEYANVLNMIAELEQKKKEIESFLKSLTAPIEILDDSTGEMIKINPPTKINGGEVMRVVESR
jgi:hypothetical protein